MSAWPDYDGKVINVEFRVSDDPKAAAWLFMRLDQIIADSPNTRSAVTPHPDISEEFVTGWGDLAEVRT